MVVPRAHHWGNPMVEIGERRRIEVAKAAAPMGMAGRRVFGLLAEYEAETLRIKFGQRVVHG